jgi:hypothetical protein
MPNSSSPRPKTVKTKCRMFKYDPNARPILLVATDLSKVQLLEKVFNL